MEETILKIWLVQNFSPIKIAWTDVEKIRYVLAISCQRMAPIGVKHIPLLAQQGMEDRHMTVT